MRIQQTLGVPETSARAGGVVVGGRATRRPSVCRSSVRHPGETRGDFICVMVTSGVLGHASYVHTFTITTVTCPNLGSHNMQVVQGSGRSQDSSASTNRCVDDLQTLAAV